MIRYIISIIISALPSTRFYSLKRFLLRAIGYEIGANVRICSSVKLMISHLSIRDNTFIGHETMILGGDSKVSIGRDCDISSNVMISTGTHNITPLSNKIADTGHSEDIIIGNGVWIGISSTILSGVTIGDMSVIAAGSVVNKSIPSYCIAGGVPCKPIKTWNKITQEWEKV